MVISNANVSNCNGITYLPVYMLMFFCPTASPEKIVKFTPL